MPLRSKRLAVAAVLAAVAATAVPAAPATAAELKMGPCQVKPLFSVIEYQQTVAVYGQYTAAGATDVRLTCGIVRYGSTAKRVSEAVPGPVAAIATTTTVGAGPVSACYEVLVTYVDHTTFTSTCP